MDGWGNVASRPRLKSLWHDHVWRPGLQTAVCESEAIDRIEVCANPPTEHCACGYYAEYYPRRTDLAEVMLIPWEMVDGLVAGFGRTYFHAIGWRAEKTVLLGVLDEGSSPTPRRVAELYDVPAVKTVDALFSIADGHGLRLMVGSDNWIS